MAEECEHAPDTETATPIGWPFSRAHSQETVVDSASGALGLGAHRLPWTHPQQITIPVDIHNHNPENAVLPQAPEAGDRGRGRAVVVARVQTEPAVAGCA